MLVGGCDTGSPGLTTTGDDLVLEGRHVGSKRNGSVLVMCVKKKTNRKMRKYGWHVRGRKWIVWKLFNFLKNRAI